jgi:glycosyltransferase involved in cell wall biosynthesis
VQQLGPDFDIEVFDLNQSFMRSTDPAMTAVADGMIKDFCARAGTFDFVNIQLEHGTVGALPKDILRRLKWIVTAARALSVTFHTVLLSQKFDRHELFKNLSRIWIAESWKIYRDHLSRNALANGVYQQLRDAAKTKPVSLIVHTRRDAEIMRHALGFENVYDHPLVFRGRAEAARLRATTTRDDFPILAHLPAGARLIGVFGFISKYKGFDTVVKAMRFLPEDYHLLIFGSVHPNEIQRNQPIYPYVRELLDAADVDSWLEDSGGPDGNANKASNSKGIAVAHPNNIADRIHFLGAQTDDDFARGACVCDTVVMPYLEVGQSASGAVSIALEMGARVIAAHNRTFLQLGRYFPNCIEMFDIGNHIELAERIRARPAFPPAARKVDYDADSNRLVYRAANSLPV